MTCRRSVSKDARSSPMRAISWPASPSATTTRIAAEPSRVLMMLTEHLRNRVDERRTRNGDLTGSGGEPLSAMLGVCVFPSDPHVFQRDRSVRHLVDAAEDRDRDSASIPMLQLPAEIPVAQVELCRNACAAELPCD